MANVTQVKVYTCKMCRSDWLEWRMAVECCVPSVDERTGYMCECCGEVSATSEEASKCCCE